MTQVPYGSFLNVDFMSVNELKKKQKEIEQELSDARLEFKRSQESANEKKAKLVQFEELFKEGVISKSELEAAHKESDGSDLPIRTAKSHVDDLQSTLDCILKRLKLQGKHEIQPKRSNIKKG